MKISGYNKECKWKFLLFSCFLLLLKITLGLCQFTPPLNENTTLLLPSINTTQAPVSNNTLVYDFMYLKKLPWWCSYSNDLVDETVEVKDSEI